MSQDPRLDNTDLKHNLRNWGGSPNTALQEHTAGRTHISVAVLTLVLTKQGWGDPRLRLDHPAGRRGLVVHGWWRDHHGTAPIFTPKGKHCPSHSSDKGGMGVGEACFNPRVYNSTLHPTHQRGGGGVNRRTNHKAPSCLFVFPSTLLWHLRQWRVTGSTILRYI